MRDATRQREMDCIYRIVEGNRQLVSLCFGHPKLFAVLINSPHVDPEWEEAYMQLRLNQFAVLHAFIKGSALKGEFRESLELDLDDFMTLPAMRRHWEKRGKIYPPSFQKRINDLLKKIEPSPVATAQSKPK